MKKIIQYTWTELEIDTILLAENVFDSKYKFQKIVAISRGGLFVAGMIAQFFEPCPIETISVSSYQDKLRKKRIRLFTKIDKISREKVLICDDIVDSGRTILFVKKFYPNSKVVVLHKNHNSRIQPDYFVREVDKWVRYPWEKTWKK